LLEVAMGLEFRVYRQAVAIIRDYASTVIDSNTDYEESLAIWSLIYAAADRTAGRFFESREYTTEELLSAFVEEIARAYEELTGKTWADESVAAPAATESE
jgi:hypothetical protein